MKADYDLVVIGGTPGGVACAVRAAREGSTVLLVNRNGHIGGMMANGLGQWDALYGGHRAPLFSELLRNIEQHYRKTYGETSRDYQVARYTHEHYPLGWTEPHVAEREFSRLVAGEKNITLLLNHIPVSVEREGALLRGVTLREFEGTKEITVRAASFADATYEGDLAALAKVPYRVGREARDEFNEPHAGKIFVNIAHGPAPTPNGSSRLNLRPYGSRQGSIDPTSPFTADGAVQAYNLRFCLTCDPKNRILPAKPAGYRREEYVDYERKYLAASTGPNRKSHMNSPILPGENHAYPDADWETRMKIEQRHLEFGLGLIYFLQNDESVPAAKRKQFREWGLPKDEFTDNHHVPYEMYVREARRIVGRHVYTEQDNSLAPGLGRTPVMSDSIAITDWYMDSHACTTESRKGYKYDGKLILTEESRPGQIPYRSLLPQGVDNLLVPVCLSATHVAWGAVRLEPVWMETGEAAGFAAALAKRDGVTPAALDSDRLLRALVEARFTVSFFNDVDVGSKEDWIPAVQYFGTKGFFATYDARPNDPLDETTARSWAEGYGQLRSGTLNPTELGRSVMKIEKEKPTKPVTAATFLALLPAGVSGEKRAELSGREGSITRAEACRLLYGSPRPTADAPSEPAARDVPRSRFLLLDNRVIEKTENAKLTVGSVRKHEVNPLFVEDKPWEKRYDNFYGNVVYDAGENLYRCWYSPFTVDHSAKEMSLEKRQERYRPPRGREMSICYATSQDGIKWEKPELGLVEYEGSKANNIIWRGPHGAGIFRDDRAQDPAHRYKIIFQGLKTAYSADGLHWSEALKVEGIKLPADTHNNALWAPTLDKYVGITRTKGALGREVTRIESDDFTHWSRQEVVLQGLEKNLQPYSMPVFFHGGVYIGLVAIHDQKADRVWTELAWSPDTREWHRVDPGTPLIPCSDKKLDYDYGCVYACAYPVFLKDEIRLYYGGSDYLHFGWRNGAFCLATLRPDGFAGYTQESKDGPAVITTRAIPYEKGALQITGDVAKGGSIKTSIVDADGQVLSTAKVVSATVTDKGLSFEKKITASRIRLRFELSNARLYSFSLGNAQQ